MSPLKESQLLFLSHPLSHHDPFYGGRRGASFRDLRSISMGDACNQMEWTLNNHFGTHMDAPAHFCKEGWTVDAVPAKDWVFQRIGLWEYAAKEDELIPPPNPSTAKTFPPEMDLLLIRTGYEGKRREPAFWEHNPGISVDLAHFFKKEFPTLRAIGFDFISVTAFQHRDEGRKAHRALLCGEQPVWVIEDMALAGLFKPPREVIVSPLRVKSADGSPVTVFGVVG